MLSKQQQKYVQSLHNKKYRQHYQCFLVEGQKNVSELLQSDFEIETLFATTYFLDSTKVEGDIRVEVVSQAELERISTLQTNDSAVAVVKMPLEKPFLLSPTAWTLALDSIRDPGNLGTIIRIADWYGIRQLLLSENCVEVYNPKVIMATMGSFTRINWQVVSLPEYLASSQLPCYGALLDGNSVHSLQPQRHGIIIIGNESHGLSAEVIATLTDKITIPRFGEAESLNAGVATAVILDNLVRQLPSIH